MSKSYMLLAGSSIHPVSLLEVAKDRGIEIIDTSAKKQEMHPFEPKPIILPELPIIEACNDYSTQTSRSSMNQRKLRKLARQSPHSKYNK